MHPTGSLAQLVAARNDECPGFPFLYVERDGPWTIGTIARGAHDLASRLAAVGVGPHTRVLLRLGNDERFIVALTATWLAGASAIAMHPSAPIDDVVRVAESMSVVAVVGAGDDVARDHVTTFLDAPRPPLDTLEPVRLDVPDIADDDEALVLLTSGSTGAPKGVALTHGNAWSNLRATVSAFRRDTNPSPLRSEGKPPNLIANPLSHTAGVVRMLFALYVGRAVVLLRKFDAAEAKAAIDTHGIDNLTINPTMMRMLLDHVPPIDGLGRVRYVSSGTAPLPAALREAFEARFRVPVLQAYGQTEAFGGIAIENVKEVLAGRRRPGSVGKALPGVEIRVVRDGEAAASHVDGEIWVRSDASTRGYVGPAAADSPIDSEGWLRTGDIGHLDGDGYLYLTGRAKNLIICGGFNIVPEEVEAALMADPTVRDAVVVGVPDDRLGEVPVAVVEARGETGDILALVGARLAPFKRPRRLVVVDSLPRVPNGKVDVPACRALLGYAPR